MEIWENQLTTEINSGGFQLSIVAAFTDVSSAKYILRIEKPNWDRVDYVGSLEGFKKLGELLLNMHSFIEEKLNGNDKVKLKDVLTAENLREYAKLKKALKIS